MSSTCDQLECSSVGSPLICYPAYIPISHPLHARVSLPERRDGTPEHRCVTVYSDMSTAPHHRQTAAPRSGSGDMANDHQLNRTVEQLLLAAASDRNRSVRLWSAVNGRVRRRAVQPVALAALLLAVAVAACVYVPSLNWTASAVGRIALIRGVLPLWDWRHLDGDLCLWAKSPAASAASQQLDHSGGQLDAESSCDYCERIGKSMI